MITEYILHTPFFIVRILQIAFVIFAVDQVIKRLYHGRYPPRFGVNVKAKFLQSHLLRRPNNSDSESNHYLNTSRISTSGSGSCSTASDSESSILAYVSTLFLEDADDNYSSYSAHQDDNSSDSDSSILAYVSTLFLEEAEDNYSKDEHSTPQRELLLKDGLVARILPPDQTEYERCKPGSRRCNAVALRQQLGFQNLNEPFAPIMNENDEFSVKSRQKQHDKDVVDDLVVHLQVNVTVPSSSSSTVLHCVEMRMQRDAKEAANRSLQRLPMSLEAKLQKQERLLNRSGRKSRVKSTFRAMQASIWIPNDESTPGEDSVSISCGEDADDTDVALDGYRRYPLTNDISSATLWNELSRPRSTVLLPKLCMTYNDGKMVPPICMPITACPPTIMSVHTFEDFEARVFVGVPLTVEAHILHATRAVVVWFADGVEVCRDSNSYTPTKEDTGKRLSVLIIPIRPGHSGEGCEEAFEYKNPVEALPSLPLIHPMRDAWTIRNRDTAPADELRVLSYNLLADLYASREVDQEVMYNHCPVQFLARRRRMPLLLYEMLVYQPDVICLQEVDASIFSGLFRPCLESQGYQGYYSNKASVQLEGCAMFWSLRRFEPVDDLAMQVFSLGDLFHKCKGSNQLCRWDSLDDIDRLLDSNEELSQVIREKVGQVVQVAELRLRSTSRSDQDHPTRIVVGNTHLFYHPLADHIRAMQAWIVCRQMDIVRRQHGASCPLLLCGDFNSGPLSGAVHLLLERRVGPEHRETWKHLRDYEWEMGDQDFLLEHGYIGNDVDTVTPIFEEEAFEDARQCLDPEDDELEELKLIRLPPSFPTLVSGYPEIPEFTNFAVDFKETLDYILASKPSEKELYGLTLKDAAPTPTSNMMKTYSAMPNEFMPSDHVSLVCDFKWQCYWN
jgi:mRNA deadenylase 3'-5' endonuclease subunit Ccr4